MNNDQNIPSKKEKKILPRPLRRVITAAVIAAVLLLNVLFGALAYKGLWYIDTTQPKYEEMEHLYTISNGFADIMDKDVVPSIEKINSERKDNGEDELTLNIIFCADSDKLEKDSYTKYVHHTARWLEKNYSEYVNISYTDVVKNPSSVQKYKVTSATTIFPTDVIFEFGSESHVHSLSSFYTTDTDTGEIWGYNGEKKFAATILSLTSADSPICALTVNHGEGLFNYSGESITVKDEYSAFIKIIEGAGYEVRLIDLEKDEIPEDCRMIICFAPTKDFKAFGSMGESGISEISKLDKYLDEARSFFYISDTTAPVLNNLEEYLSEWGIAPSRELLPSGIYDNYKLYDKQNTLNDGSVLIGKYTTTGYGSSLTTDLRDLAYPPTVVFGNASAVGHSENYNKIVVMPDEEGGVKSIIYSYYNNGISRTMYDVLTSYESAYALVGSDTRYASENDLYSLFTLTEETDQIQEDSLSVISLSSYVLGLSSTDFLKNEFLDSASYGNADVLLAALRATSAEVIPVNLEAKALYNEEINDTLYMTLNTTAPMVILAVIPLVCISVTGIVICVRRKYK